MSDPHRGSPGTVSRMCAEGKHTRCLGTVFVYPPVDGQRLAACACPVKNCGHGTELEKKVRRRATRTAPQNGGGIGSGPS